MKTRKRTVIFLLVCLFFLIGMIGNITLVLLDTHQTNETTTEMTSTIRSIERMGSTSESEIVIHTNETSFELWMLPSVFQRTPISSLLALEPGETIHYRVKNSDISGSGMTNQDGQISKFNILLITALSTETETFFTLEDYNRDMLRNARPALITATVIALLALAGVIFCIRKLRKG